MTALLILGIIAMILLVVALCLALHILRQSSSDAFRALERIESRQQKHLDTVLDRLMTIKWEDYAVVRATDEDQEGGFIPPQAQRDEPGEQEPPKWARMSSMKERLGLLAGERELLEEDFPVEMGVKP